MAWNFVAEDGTGLPNSTSYISLEDAQDYFFPDVNFAPIWTGLTNDQRLFYLGWATRILDQKTSWRGTIATDTQALRWPRAGVKNRDGLLIASNEVPSEVKAAVCELAKYLLSNDPTTGPDTDNLKSIKVDVIEIAFQPKAVESTYPSIINAILQPLGVFKIGGSGFGRILKT